MASKLDMTIANLAIVISTWDRKAMLEAAPLAAAEVKPKDVAKLPDKWYPAVSAKGAGVPELKDPWDHLWFEALAEILFQKKEEGLPHLLTLWERDDSTYNDLILIRLLQLAVEGVEAEQILERVRTRFTNLHYTQAYGSIREVANWTSEDRRPIELLIPMSEIVVPRSDGDTVGKYIAQMIGEKAILDAEGDRGHRCSLEHGELCVAGDQKVKLKPPRRKRRQEEQTLNTRPI